MVLSRKHLLHKQEDLRLETRGHHMMDPPKTSMVVHSYEASTREAETGRSLKLTSQLVLLNREAPGSVRDPASIDKVEGD